MEPRIAHPADQAVGRQGLLRDLNCRAVYERLATVGPASRTDLAKGLDVSAAVVGRVIERLLRADLVREGERVVSGVGRPQTMIHLNADAGLVAGFSIRSTSMRLHLADLSGRLLVRSRVDRTDAGASDLARQVRDVVADALHTVGEGRRLASVVVGISGVWNEHERQVYAAPNLALLEGIDLKSRLVDALEGLVVPAAIAIDNDVNYAALGEGQHGSARGVRDFFYVSLGSGVGGAAFVGGRLHRGPSGFAGEVGALPVARDGRIVTLEDLVGRRALQELAHAAGAPSLDDEELGRADRHEVVDRVVDVLGQALVSVVAVLDPELIVLGGGLGRHGGGWTGGIRTRLSSFLPTVPRVQTTELGREASLLGAVDHGRVLARETLLTQELAA